MRVVVLVMCLLATACGTVPREEVAGPSDFSYTREDINVFAQYLVRIKHPKTGSCFLAYEVYQGVSMIEVSKEICE